MRILHTSDWHIGRTFHGYALGSQLTQVLDAIVEQARTHRVDAVVVSGDIFDSATPAAQYYELLNDTLLKFHQAKIPVVLSSGNHDSAARLGFQAPFAQEAGIYVRTKPADLAEPISFRTDWGEVAIYAIPYLEPIMVNHLWPDQRLRTQAEVLAAAMEKIRLDLRDRKALGPVVSVVMAHTFAAGVQPSDGVEREIRAGGVDVVPLSIFEGIDYVALGHIHGQAILAPNIRYSGAPLHYSFSEENKARGTWLVDLDSDGLREVQWLDLPVPRQLVTLKGELADLLNDAEYSPHAHSWVRAILTDTKRPVDAMRKLQERFPYCATLEFSSQSAQATQPTRGHVRTLNDEEVFADFLNFARGEGPDVAEREVIQAVITQERMREQQR